MTFETVDKQLRNGLLDLRRFAGRIVILVVLHIDIQIQRVFVTLHQDRPIHRSVFMVAKDYRFWCITPKKIGLRQSQRRHRDTADEPHCERRKRCCDPFQRPAPFRGRDDSWPASASWLARSTIINPLAPTDQSPKHKSARGFGKIAPAPAALLRWPWQTHKASHKQRFSAGRAGDQKRTKFVHAG